MAWDTFVCETGTSVPQALSLGLKQLVREADQSSALVVEVCRVYLDTGDSECWFKTWQLYRRGRTLETGFQSRSGRYGENRTQPPPPSARSLTPISPVFCPQRTFYTDWAIPAHTEDCYGPSNSILPTTNRNKSRRHNEPAHSVTQSLTCDRLRESWVRF